MSSNKLLNVTETYFQHKVLTKVPGKPTYDSLQQLQTEIKANAASVPSIFGGGLYGHLGLIVSPARYATLADTVPWVSPQNPGVFEPPESGTGPQIEAAREVWRDANFSFELFQATEKAIVAQIVEAIDLTFLRALLNRTTGQYSSGIHAIMKHLFTTYGRITPQQVKERELATITMHYDINQPVDVVFDAIEDLVDLAEHADSPMSLRQMIDMAFVIFAKQPVLQQDLRDWNKKSAADKTWENMLTHFRDAQSDLSALPTAGDVYHQANIVADIISQQLREVIPPSGPGTIEPSVTGTINAAIQERETAFAAREAALLAKMESMMALMTAVPTTRAGRGGGRSNNNNRTRNPGRGNTRNNDIAPRHYCWTHGSCAHTSSACQHKSDGHKDNASFENMMNGSKKNCFWLG
jgi:hypothetical protein